MKTVKLKEICNTLSNFVQYVAIRPITDLVCLVAKDNMLYIGCTDIDNATIVATIECDKTFGSTVVKLSDLSKLVKATTVDDITLEGKEDYLEFKGNGKYKLQIQLDENGDKITLPIQMPSMGEPKHVENIGFVYKRNDSFIDKSGTLPFAFDVYYCDGVHTVTTNNICIASTNYNTQISEINPYMMKSLQALPKEFDISEVNGGYRIDADCYRAYYKTEITHDFPVDTVMPLVTNIDVYHDTVNINKKDLLSAIKRESLFKTAISTPKIYLTFGDSSITIENAEKTFYEEIPCDGSANNFKVITKTDSLLAIVRLMEDDITINLADKFICLEDTLGKYIIASMEE